MTEQAHRVGVPEWTLGDRLGKGLAFAGISHQQMADYLRVSRNTVGNYVADRTKIPYAALELWARRTRVPIDWYLAEGPATPPGRKPDKLAALTEAKARRARGGGSHTLGVRHDLTPAA